MSIKNMINDLAETFEDLRRNDQIGFSQYRDMMTRLDNILQKVHETPERGGATEEQGLVDDLRVLAATMKATLRSNSGELVEKAADVILALSASASAHPADERHVAEEREALHIEDDYSHIYWRDPVEGCWVAYRRADCVGEEELPAKALSAPIEDHKSSRVTPNCMTDDQGCEVQ